jgi:type IV pilus assembly protein PilE
MLNARVPRDLSRPVGRWGAAGLRGFTLIELLVVVGIVGILAAVAYPSYVDQVKRAKRSDAQTVLMESAQYLQRYYAAQNSFTAATLPASLAQSPRSGTKAYDITLPPDSLTARNFKLVATPVFSDAKCGNLTLTDAGQKGTSTDNVVDCWR